MRRRQHLHRRFGDLPLAERARHLRHRIERARTAHMPLRGRTRKPLAMGEPRGRRQVAVGGIDLPALELGHTPPPFCLEHTSGPFDLVQVARERLVGERTKVLGSKLLEGRPEAAHRAETIEQVFERL